MISVFPFLIICVFQQNLNLNLNHPVTYTIVTDDRLNGATVVPFDAAMHNYTRPPPTNNPAVSTQPQLGAIQSQLGATQPQFGTTQPQMTATRPDPSTTQPPQIATQTQLITSQPHAANTQHAVTTQSSIPTFYLTDHANTLPPGATVLAVADAAGTLQPFAPSAAPSTRGRQSIEAIEQMKEDQNEVRYREQELEPHRQNDRVSEMITNIRDLQRKDRVLRQLYSILTSDEAPPKMTETRDKELRSYLNRIKKYSVKNKTIYRSYGGKDLPVLPISEYGKIFRLFHLPGHSSSSKMIQDIQDHKYSKTCQRIYLSV